MIAKERQNLIVDQLRSQKLVNAQELAAQFGVSIVTIRRDLDQLVERGIAKRIYGGAMLEESVQTARNGVSLEQTVYSGRELVRHAEKIAIARTAAGLVREGETIFIDCGTTTCELARQLREMRHLTVVTNSLTVLNELRDCENITLYCVGGQLHGNESRMSGNIALSVLRNFYLDCAFIGAAGVTFEGGMTEFYYDTVDLRKMAMEHSNHVVLMTDSSKFGVKTFAVVDDLSAVNTIITDSGIPEEYSSGIQQMNIELMIAEPEK